MCRDDGQAEPLPTDQWLECGATTIALLAVLVARTVKARQAQQAGDAMNFADYESIAGLLMIGIPVFVLFLLRKSINWGTGTGGHDFDLPDRSDSSTPAFNTDGTAMCGGFDAHGNAYGVRRIEWDK